MRFRTVIAAELDQRRRRDARYSLRRFARTLGIHHSTLSRLLRATQRVPAQTLQTVAPRLGFTDAQIAEFLMQEDIAAVTGAIRRPAFRPDCRWIASRAGISIDRVNIVLFRLLRAGALRMMSAQKWELRNE